MTDSDATLVVQLGTANGELVAVEAGVKLLRKSIDLGGNQVPSEEDNQYLDQLLEKLVGAINDSYHRGDPGDGARPDPVEVPLTVSAGVLLCRLFRGAERLGAERVAVAAMNAGLRFDGSAEDFQAMHRQWADVANRIEALLPPDARQPVEDPGPPA